MNSFSQQEHSPVSVSQQSDDVFVRGNLMHREIPVVQAASLGDNTKADKFKGKYRRWPGAVLLVTILAVAAVLITYAAMDTRTKLHARNERYNNRNFNRKKIKGGDNATKDDQLIGPDGEIGNPKQYPASTCELPNYVSRNGRILAVSSNGTQVAVDIKGVNWFGMETGQAIPFGLWDNDTSATTAYQVALFLSDNKFNGVRLPLMADHLLKNKVPNQKMINTFTNQAVCVRDYMCMLKSIIKVLQYRNIGVLISMHTLTNSDNGKLWYNGDITEDKFLDAIDLLTSNLCTSEYWNVLGIDLKNEPYGAKWGVGPETTDFRIAAQTITNRMLKGCKNWMGFVEGLNGQRTVTIDGEKFSYYDWYGGGMQEVGDAPIGELLYPDKIVYAPHYYTSAVVPQLYFYGGGTQEPGTLRLLDFVELSDEALLKRVEGTMTDMFGYLVKKKEYALLLGEFAGLYTNDQHPKKTIQRTVDSTMKVMVANGYAGGFMWSLNPESKYQFASADVGTTKEATFSEGLLQDDWLGANKPYLKSMELMNELPNLKKFPCFEMKASSDSSN